MTCVTLPAVSGSATGLGHVRAAYCVIPTLDEFQSEARAFLDAHASRSDTRERSFVWGEGDDNVSLIEEKEPGQDEAELVDAKAWAAARWDAGFGWIDGPTAYGGRGLSAQHKQAYRALESGYDLPDQSFFTIGLGMVAPTILAHATEETKRAYLRSLHRGDLLACQLFSEPGAGSDLASVATRAERDGEEWVITGQKVWTSNAHLSDIGEIICRTDPDQPKHRGLTAFVVDMRAPGIEVVPLRQMTGGAGFNEVFLTDVRVPDTHRLGDVNAGWGVALTTLLNERASLGSGMGLGRGPGPFERLMALLRHFEGEGDPLLRQAIAALYAQHRVSAWTLGRGMAPGPLPGPELSILKLLGTKHLDDMSAFVARVLGPKLTADTGEWGTFAWGQLVCGVPGGHLGGGTDEVLRNIIGERVLGLQKEPGIDSTTPFKDLVRS
ncbi:MAG: acyl-CoA dehydrogenase family protein [Acidimicrobiales bacterium]